MLTRHLKYVLAGAGSVSVYCVSVRTEFDSNYPACTCNPSADGGGAHMTQENPWGLRAWESSLTGELLVPGKDPSQKKKREKKEKKKKKKRVYSS